MKDLGIQPRVIECAKDFVKKAPNTPLTASVRSLIQLSEGHDLFDPKIANAADVVFDEIREIDTDRDGIISVAESPFYRELSELYSALAENDRDGPLTALPAPSAPPKGAAKAVQASAKPTAPPKPQTPANTPRLELVPGSADRLIVMTLWSSRGARYAFEQSKKNIELIRPHVVLAHTDPVALANGGGQELTDDIRAAYPWLGVGWAFYGDSYGPDPSAIWERCGVASEKAQVATCMPNTEAAWKKASRGNHTQRSGIMRKSLVALRKGAPTRHLSITSFDGWVNIVWGKGRWGGHEDMPIRAMLGEATPVQAEAAQVYTAASDTGDGASFEAAMDRYARHVKSRDAAIRKGLIDPKVEAWMYLQLHSCRTSNICYLAEQRRVTVGWAGPTRIDANGVKGLCAARKLADLKMTVEQFQKENGISPVDKKAGALTLKKLGIE